MTSGLRSCPDLRPRIFVSRLKTRVVGGEEIV
jgi:hypothetical protein